MHEALTGLADTADLALASVRDIAGDSGLERTAELVADARTRLDYPDDAIVVALAGGTGSGKSSLFNAIVGADAAPVGELRPTTSEPVAAVPDRYPAAFDGYFDLMGIDRRVPYSEARICLIDLPDTDSVVAENRHRVEEVMPRIDVLVWVVDPEKYRDAALHHRYLRPLAGYSSQWLFVLNQVDRLTGGDADAVVADLLAALTEDGVSEPLVVRTSVAPGLPPEGVDALVGELQRLAAHRHTLYRKLVADMARAAVDLERAVGGPIGYRDLLSPVVEAAAQAMAGEDRRTAVEEMGRFCDEVATRIGGLPARRVIALAAAIPQEVESALASLPASTSRSWKPWSRSPVVPAERLESARVAIQRILGPVTALMTARARALALVAELAVGAARANSLVATSG